ncbi:hypothetical protein BX666DRAFT_881425 [Dichotomocladium elegans]|nr:hypothetical protein BX666DRAFT_881425 [Dichotomocladium elegans]
MFFLPIHPFFQTHTHTHTHTHTYRLPYIMQYYIEERHTSSPLGQIFVQPNLHHGYSPFRQQQSPLYFYGCHANAAAIESERLLIERQLTLERERQRRRAFLLQKIAQEEREQAELERYYQWQLKRQIEQQREQQRRRMQAALLERQRQIEAFRYQQEQQLREHQEHCAKAISTMLRHVLEEDEEMEEAQSEHQQQSQEPQTPYTEMISLMLHQLWEKEDDEMEESQPKQEPASVSPKHVSVTAIKNDMKESKSKDIPEPLPMGQQKDCSEAENCIMQQNGGSDHEEECISEDIEKPQQVKEEQEQQGEDGKRSDEQDNHSELEDTEMDCEHDKDVTPTGTGTTESQAQREDDGLWEEISTSSADEDDDIDEKRERLRLIGDQLAQLSEKHANTLPLTRLQFHDDVSEVTATSADNRQFLGLEDEVMQVMLQLDSISSGGSDIIRKERKALIRKAEDLLASMDEHKQHEWERISVHSATSDVEGKAAAA